MNRYQRIIERVFLDRYHPGDVEVPFVRQDLIDVAQHLGVTVPRNLGDILYAFRYRTELPESITSTAPAGMEWTIHGTGQAAYKFGLVTVNRIVPNPALMTIKIPDATPEIVSAHAMSDEQALLAKIRYNRLLDVFLGVSAYSLQSHLRTTVKSIGQIEVDEIYVAVDSTGRQFVMPVQAKGGSDQLSVVQSEQDLLWCRERLPNLICRPVLTQFAEGDLIAMFEVTLDDDEIKVVQEKHYRLVPASEVTPEDLSRYRNST
ncbi:MAG: endonuclease [Gammaproteobacteria bacterium]|nr:endonuclease [Gammaproteobacteria bacterium]